MKNFFLLTCLIIIPLFGFAQDVPEVQRPLITKIAATWCPPCGGWGWDFFEHLIDDNNAKATLMVAHHSGDLVSTAGEEFSENFASPYQPYFYFYNADQGVNGGNVTQKRAAVASDVDLEATMQPLVNAGMIVELNDGVLTINTKTKFFQEAEGDYSLGVYIVENGVINQQAGQGANAVHEKVLRGAVSASTFGDSFVNGTVTAGQEFSKTYMQNMASDWVVGNLEVATVIWKNNDGVYEAVNSNWTNDISISTSTEELKTSNRLFIAPNIVEETAIIVLDYTDEASTVDIDLFDLKGERVAHLFDGNVQEISTGLSFEKGNLSAGVYFVQAKLGDKLLTKKIVIR